VKVLRYYHYVWYWLIFVGKVCLHILDPDVL
jgi:hypothetical protein